MTTPVGLLRMPEEVAGPGVPGVMDPESIRLSDESLDFFPAPPRPSPPMFMVPRMEPRLTIGLGLATSPRSLVRRAARPVHGRKGSRKS